MEGSSKRRRKDGGAFSAESFATSAAVAASQSPPSPSSAAISEQFLRELLRSLQPCEADRQEWREILAGQTTNTAAAVPDAGEQNPGAVANETATSQTNVEMAENDSLAPEEASSRATTDFAISSALHKPPLRRSILTRIVLATHVLRRLLRAHACSVPKKSTTAAAKTPHTLGAVSSAPRLTFPSSVHYLPRLALSLSLALTQIDTLTTKLDRVSLGPARHVLGRALLAISLVLPITTPPSTPPPSLSSSCATEETLRKLLNRNNRLAGALALDRVLQWQMPASSDDRNTDANGTTVVAGKQNDNSETERPKNAANEQKVEEQTTKAEEPVDPSSSLAPNANVSPQKWESSCLDVLTQYVLSCQVVDLGQIAAAFDWKEECTVWSSLLLSQPPVVLSFGCSDSLVDTAVGNKKVPESEAAVSEPLLGGTTTPRASKRLTRGCRKANETAALPTARIKKKSKKNVGVGNKVSPTLEGTTTTAPWARFWEKANAIEIDGRLASRRWTSFALVWFLPGQLRLLETALDILSFASNNQCSKEEATLLFDDFNLSKSSHPPLPSPNALLMALSARIVRMVYEIGSACGNRPTSNCGVETFVKSIVDTVKVESTKKTSSAIKLRADLRNIGTVLLTKLIDLQFTLLGAPSNQQHYGSIFVNESEGFDQDPGSIFFHPQLSEVLLDLARAAHSSVCISSYLEQGGCADKMLHIAAAWVFKRQVEEKRQHSSLKIFLDLKLMRFAITRLTRCLTSYVSVPSVSLSQVPDASVINTAAPIQSQSLQQEAERLISLDVPLPRPVTGPMSWSTTPTPMLPTTSKRPPASSRRKKATGGSSDGLEGVDAAVKPFCSFGGIFSPPNEQATSAVNLSAASSSLSVSRKHTNPWDELLALYFRAMLSDNVTADNSNTAESLLSHVIEILERCHFDCATNVTAVSATLADFNNTTVSKSATNRKRPLDCITVCKKKKGKTDDGLSSSEPSVNESFSTESTTLLRRMGPDLISLASETMAAIGCCIRRQQQHKGLESVLNLQKKLHQALTTDHIFRIIDVGMTIEQVINRVHGTSLASTTASHTSSPKTDLVYSLEKEKVWWEAYSDLCLCIGRGQPSSTDAKVDILSDSRLAVYQKIATFRHQCGFESFGSWPLWLPAPHRILVFANLASEVIGTGKQQSAPDRYIVDGVISAISEAFANPSLLVASSSASPVSLFVEECVPLSLNNARLFASAIMRLQEKDRLVCFSSLIEAVNSGLICFGPNSSQRVLLQQCRGVSSFFGRVISLCTSLAISLTCHPSLPYKILRLGLSQGSYLTKINPMIDFNRSQNCFFDLLEDWEISLKDTELTRSTMKKDLSENLQFLLEQSFRLSFLSATTDHCYFLFSCWVALGKCDLWSDQDCKVTSFSGLPDDYSALMLQLRNEMCHVHCLILKINGSSSLPSIFRVADQKDQANKLLSRKALISTVKKELRSMTVKGSSLCAELLHRFVSTDSNMQQSIPSEIFVIWEMLTAYLSFVVSSYTRPDVDFFTHTRSSLSDSLSEKRPRAYSSGSEHYPTDDESNDTIDVALETFDRVDAVCCTFGSVPAYPDWLDADCHLWETVTFAESLETACDALKTLSKLAAISYQQAEGCRLRSVKDKPGNVVKLAFQLSKLNSYETYSSATVKGSTNNNLSQYISQVSGIDAAIIDLWNDETFKDQDLPACCWARNTAQRILGSQQGLLSSGQVTQVARHVLRASGEWEVLLSLSLTTCGGDISARCGSVPVNFVDVDNLELSVKWYSVYRAACSSLMPASALLRFSLCKKGRGDHPLKSADACVDNFSFFDLDVKCAVESSLQNVNDVVSDALAIVTRDFYEAKKLCDAVATNLVVDLKTLRRLRAVHACRFALITLKDLTNCALLCSDFGASALLFQLVASVLDTYRGGMEDYCPDKLRSYILMTALGDKSYTFKAIATEERSVWEALQFAYTFEDMSGTPYNDDDKISTLTGITSSIWPDCMYINPATRISFLNILCSLAQQDSLEKQRADSFSIATLLVKTFSAVELSRLIELVKIDVCGVASIHAGYEDFSTKCTTRSLVCMLLAFVLSASSKSEVFERKCLVYQLIEDNISSWSQLPFEHREEVLNLWFLYAVNIGKLHYICHRFIGTLHASRAIDSASILDVQNISSLGAFANKLKKALSVRKNEIFHAKKPCVESESSFPRLCSYAVESGFIEQHWYNCYTCDLVDDKGCCTVCALICHKDHDVSYSRYSTFFCDCGAPDENRIGNANSSCQCQSPLHSDVVEQAFARGRGEIRPFKDCISGDITLTKITANICSQISSKCFAAQSTKSLNLLEKEGVDAEWPHFFFDLIKEGLNSHMLTTSEPQTAVSTASISYEQLQRRLRRREATLGANVTGSRINLFLLAKFRPGSFQTSLLSDNAVDNLRLASLATGVTCRAAISADKRGRVIIAEPTAISFCTGLPILNATNAAVSGISLPASCMQVLKKRTFEYNILGVSHCEKNDAFLVVWGSRSATVCILNESRTDIVEKTELDLALKPLDNVADFLVHCEWLPGSPSCLVATCATSIHIFDVMKSSSSVAVILAGPDATIRGSVIVEDLEICADVMHCSWKVFLLRNDGHLHAFDLTRMRDGEIKVHNSNLDSKYSIKLPIAGSSVDTDMLFSLTLGEGSHLTFLKQSRLILYQAVGENVLALQLDAKGSIVSSFTLLPKEIFLSPQTDSTEPCYHVSGPFTHWTELGMVEDDTSAFFRAMCVARRATKEHVVLCIEYNENETRVTDLTFKADDCDNINSSSLFVEGVTALSYPHKNSSMNGCQTFFDERVAAFILFSDGSIFVFGEAAGAVSNFVSVETSQTKLHSVSCAITNPLKKSRVPLLAFEEMKNVMDDHTVLFEGDGLGSSDDIRFKLERDRPSYLMAPNQEGFAFLVKLKSESSRLKRGESDRVIIAIRFLAGSSSIKCIPKSISVVGRQMELVPGKKKWYTFHMTSTEIALTLRNGFVTIFVGPTFDSGSKPALDALEVFAVARSTVNDWLPTTLKSVLSPSFYGHTSKAAAIVTDRFKVRSTSLFFASLDAFKSLSQVFGQSKPLAADESKTLEQILEVFALKEDERVASVVEKILVTYKLDDDSRHSFHDKAVLRSCSSFLSSCQESLSSKNLSEEAFEVWWQDIALQLGTCFRAAVQIAKCRPMSYFQAIGTDATSPGVSASLFVPACLNRTVSNLNIVISFVELSLVEMAVASSLGADRNERTRIGNFGGIRKLLMSSNQFIVALTCNEISSFCKRHEMPSRSGDYDLFAAQQMVAYYRCDRCELFPIKNIRYSLLDDAHPFDLCQKCYRAGKRYAASAQYQADKHVLIEGKAVGEETKLSCAEMKLMQPIVIKGHGTVSIKGEDEKNFEISTSSNSTEVLISNSNGAEFIQRHHVFDDFLEHLFNEVAPTLVYDFNANKKPTLFSIQVGIDIVKHSSMGGRKGDRARRLAKELVGALSQALDEANKGLSIVADSCTPSDILRALVRLVVPDAIALAVVTCNETVSEDVNDEGSLVLSPPPLCTTHNIPTVRRRCCSSDKRNFFICGKDRKLRCNFFAWADAYEDPCRSTLKPQSIVDDATAKAIWNMFTTFSAETSSIQSRLCRYVAQRIHQISHKHETVDFEPALSISDYCGREAAKQDFADGVCCSLNRLRTLSSRNFLFTILDCAQVYEVYGMRSLSGKTPSVVETSMSLLSLIARPTSETMATWAPILSEIILSVKETLCLKQIAKRALMQLCGRKRGLYATIRANYAFGYQRQQLSNLTATLLLTALTVVEKARQCGPFWKCGQRLVLGNLKAADLLGSEELINEDVITVRTMENIRQVLMSLTSVARKRGDIWRQFCGLEHFEGSRTLNVNADATEILRLPPAIFFFSVACLIGGENQIKAFRLLDLALSTSSKQKQARIATSLASDDEPEHVSKDITTYPFACSITPETVLNLTVSDMKFFVFRYVCRSSNGNVRLLASNIISKICNNSPPSTAGELFNSLVSEVVFRVGGLGKSANELMGLLQQLIKRAGPKNINVATASRRILCYWKSQLVAIRHGKSNCDYVYIEARIGSSIQKKRYELSQCVHCQQPKKHGYKLNNGQHSEPKSSNSSGVQVTQSVPSEPKSWHPEQVTSFSRGRLEGWRDCCTSDELNSYSSLKYRLVLSEVHLEINDPRGRFVKKLNIYFSPRPVDDVNMLKSSQYTNLWQLCGVLELTKGATRGSCELEVPVIAANIRIEYTEFYERPSDTKLSASNFVVHCPRCTRLVNNAHGVCGNCGEVAFQCRKCRHINYERLDAFLCVECGYCASGGFCFELTAAIATNSIAITNDADYQKSVRMQIVASRLYEDLRSALRDKLLNLIKKDPGESSILKRSFQGRLPIQPGDCDVKSLTIAKLGKPGAVVKAVARPDGCLDEHACSLVRLTREWRDSTADARRPTIRRQLSRLLIQESDSEDHERFAWLEGSAMSTEDPLTRLLASVQNRRERRAAAVSSDPPNQLSNSGGINNATTAAGNSLADGTNALATSGITNSQLTKEAIELCDRLALLMHEAERENFNLQSRIGAWQRLEFDSLKKLQNATELFEPSHCSVCSSHVALHLLNIWLSLLEVDSSNVTVTEETVRSFLQDDHYIVHKPLLEAKRLAVKQVALLSEHGAKFVLQALKNELHATRSVVCAEILGQIVEAKGSPAVFLELAMNILETSTMST